MNKIPAATIGLMSKILPANYTHARLDGLFLTASAPNDIPEGNKSVKVMAWLRSINLKCDDPLEVLGVILEDFMEQPQPEGIYYAENSYENNSDAIRAYDADREKIKVSLAKTGLQYVDGGVVTKGGSVSTLSLQQSISKSGYEAIDIEIKRSLKNVQKDPAAAAHSAGNVLEATLKAYLDAYKIEYDDDKATLSVLWKLFVDDIGIHPKELNSKDLKRIASGLFGIVEGTMHLRNKRSAAHGKSADQHRQSSIKPRHARLAIHSAHTVAAYIVEMIEQ